MRLALAIGILSQTVPSPSVSSLQRSQSFRYGSLQRRKVSLGRGKKNTSHASATNKNKEVGLHSNNHREFQTSTHQLRFAKRSSVQSVDNISTEGAPGGSFKECDPSDEADIGILACEPNEHCITSNNSIMGGICMQSDRSRSLQYYWWQRGNCDLAYYESCVCDEFDFMLGTGALSCLYSAYDCVGENLCGSSTVEYNRTAAGDYSVETCYYFVVPYEFPVCYRYDSKPLSCSMVIGEEECNSCQLVDVQNEYGGLDTGCFKFDCTNTIAEFAGNDCLGDYVLDTLALQFSLSSIPTGSLVPTTTFPPSVSPSAASAAPTKPPSNEPSARPSLTAVSFVPSLLAQPVAPSTPTTDSPMSTSPPMGLDPVSTAPMTSSPAPATAFPFTPAPASDAPTSAPVRPPVTIAAPVVPLPTGGSMESPAPIARPAVSPPTTPTENTPPPFFFEPTGPPTLSSQPPVTTSPTQADSSSGARAWGVSFWIAPMTFLAYVLG